jgi:hypothetical protein
MKVFNKLFICILFVFGIWAAATAQPVKYSNEFLKIGVSARAMGMGNSQVGICDDVSSGYWNPAGLAFGKKTPELSFMHAAYFANIANYNYAGFSMAVDSVNERYFGLSLIRLGVDNIPNTLKLVSNGGVINYDNVKSFSVSDFAAIFSYAWKPSFSDNLSFGTNVKIIYRGIKTFGNGWGVGVDAAVRYQTPNFMAGLTLMDATNTITAFTYNTETFQQGLIAAGDTNIPQNSIEITRPTLRLGVGYKVNMGAHLYTLLSVDNDMYFDGRRGSALATIGKTISIAPRAGMEFAYVNSHSRPIAFLRFGLNGIENAANNNGEIYKAATLSSGIGFAIKTFQLDYAFGNLVQTGDVAQNMRSHFISMKFFIK